jgi:ubiquinone/menaquinone biosynthesis C-methylase UbiE
VPFICSGLGEVPSLVWVEGDAEKLDFKDTSMDGYTIAFGIRNVTHIDKALEEAYRLVLFHLDRNRVYGSCLKISRR